MDKRTSLEITQYIKDTKTPEISWQDLADKIEKIYKVKLDKEKVRSRYRKKIVGTKLISNANNFEQHYQNGEVEINRVFFESEKPKTDKDVLRLLGYDENVWEVVLWSVGEWNTSMKGEDGQPIQTVNNTIKAKLRPKTKTELTPEEVADIFNNLIVKPKQIKQNLKKIKSFEQNRLKELSGIELHLGKMAWAGDTGQDYDKDIATNRFFRIVQEIINQQSIEQAAECLYCVGNDFFNSDTVNATTTKGTPQTNDLRWKKMFGIGLELNINLIDNLIENFEKVHIRLQSGNHDTMSSFYLYMCLMQYYKDVKDIEFSTNYKDVQCFLWGDCGIFFTHGDSNLKRTIKSIPAEFYKEWGQTKYRELHLGHLHKEVVVDDESGMITRRVGSPTGTDQWHYEERFIGATQKYQTFLWDKAQGLKSIQYINF